MYSVTLVENRSNPKRYVATLTYERKGDKVTPVCRVYDGPNHVQSVKTIPWDKLNAGKDWAQAYNGKKGKHGQSFTMKRDWLQLHQELEFIREEEVSNADAS
jgi:hypothetical protein